MKISEHETKYVPFLPSEFSQLSYLEFFLKETDGWLTGFSYELDLCTKCLAINVKRKVKQDISLDKNIVL